jgi:hypothetical protein
MASPTSTFDPIQLYKLRESLCAISERLARLPRDHHKGEIDMITDMVEDAIEDIDALEK